LASSIGPTMTKFHEEVTEGERFEFGKNWQRFAQTINTETVDQARDSLRDWLPDLEGKRFLDMGSGSGLFSLSALQLGASDVYSFDYDPDAVACTRMVQERFAPFVEREHWQITEGSALDKDFLARLGQFDVVYAWGVLHHTGAMWKALANVAPLVSPNGKLFISIYNDQGMASRLWKRVKHTYNRSGRPTRWLLTFLAGTYFTAIRMLVQLRDIRHSRFRLRPQSTRGMHWTTNLTDWLGGWPFEVAKPEQIFEFFHQRSFTLERLRTCGGGLGCNEFPLY
jgi:2-polyprenyl-3-methyl-5-hydroxy-6-metoxy-1,4-benzoquinol methylase